MLPGWGQRAILDYTKIGKPAAAWFSTVDPGSFKPSIKNRLAAQYIFTIGRLCGANLLKPKYVSVDETRHVAWFISRVIDNMKGCYVHTTVSNAVRICQAARNNDIDITGATFMVVSEPLTKIKRQEIEALGARVFPRYTSFDAGVIGFSCIAPTAPDEVHLLKDMLALIQRKREVSHAGITINSFLFTSLLLSAPKILLNVELGDYGQVEQRNCGCYYHNLGLSDHIHSIRGFDKLTSQGMTFLGTDLLRILEEILPTRFGGSSIDYQIVEEEDSDGQSYLNIIANPEIGSIDESQLIDTVLDELSEGKDTQRMMAAVWSKSNTIRVRRVKPYTTSRGKLLPLHIQKAK
jgi:phenylacetate-coenzyme A ligase PaaK-like adenylate-forming protein